MPYKAQLQATLGGGGQTLADYLAGLGAVAIYDGTLRDGKAANLGTGGSTLNAALNEVAVDENGFFFNGDDSKLVVPTSTLLTGLTAYTYISVAQAATAGGGDGGKLWGWGNTNHTGFLGDGSNPFTLNGQVARNTTNATVSQANTMNVPTEEFYYSMRWTGSVITSRLAFVGDSGLTNQSSSSNGSGGVTDLTGQVLNIGARTLDDRTWHGYIRLFAIINKALTDQEDAEVARLAQILNPS